MSLESGNRSPTKGRLRSFAESSVNAIDRLIKGSTETVLKETIKILSMRIQIPFTDSDFSTFGWMGAIFGPVAIDVGVSEGDIVAVGSGLGLILMAAADLTLGAKIKDGSIKIDKDGLTRKE